jgi:phosphoribosylformimino-5-aminoimidazole carboxamide ribotide isomerase
MFAIPQLDLRGGVCLRSNGRTAGRSGGMPTIISALEIARSWAAAGFHRIHVVDHDPIAGSNASDAVVDDIMRDGDLEVQVDNAADSGDEIERLICAGAVRVVVGPRWMDEPEWLASTAEQFPGLLIVAADVRGRRVVTRGRARRFPMAVLDVVADLNGIPLGALLVSSTPSNGHRTSTDLALIEDIADASDVPVMVEGGVRGLSDLRALEHRGVSAVLLGEPLHDGGLDPRSVALEFGDA